MSGPKGPASRILNRRTVFKPGDMAPLDSNSRYAVEFSGGSQMTMLKIPRKILEARFGEMADAAGARLAGGQGINGHLSAMPASLSENLHALDGATAEAVRNHLVDLLTHTLT